MKFMAEHSSCPSALAACGRGGKGPGESVNTSFREPLPPSEATEGYLQLLEPDGAEALKPCLPRVTRAPAK